MKAHTAQAEAVAQLSTFLTSILPGDERYASRPGRFIPGKEPRYPTNRRLGGWGPKLIWTSLGKGKSLAPAMIRSHDGPTRRLVTIPPTLPSHL